MLTVESICWRTEGRMERGWVHRWIIERKDQ